MSSKYPPAATDVDVEMALFVQSSESSFLQLTNINRSTNFCWRLVIGLDTKGFQSTRDEEGGDGSCPEFAILPVCESRPDSEVPAFSFRQLQPTSIDFTVLKGWLGYCRDHHSKTCGILPAYPKKSPDLKVIDCTTGRIVNAPSGCNFAALSYVWGSSHTREQGTAQHWGFLPDNLPKTVSDAISVVLQLDLQYLWVDKYCIDQTNRAELNQQISIMDIIYHLAAVTLIGAAGSDAAFGLPGVGSTPRKRQPTINLDGHIWLSSLQSPKPMIKTSKREKRILSLRSDTTKMLFRQDWIYFFSNSHPIILLNTLFKACYTKRILLAMAFPGMHVVVSWRIIGRGGSGEIPLVILSSAFDHTWAAIRRELNDLKEQSIGANPSSKHSEPGTRLSLRNRSEQSNPRRAITYL